MPIMRTEIIIPGIVPGTAIGPGIIITIPIAVVYPIIIPVQLLLKIPKFILHQAGPWFLIQPAITRVILTAQPVPGA